MARKAGMATGVEVARISVKVSPDTSAFRRELQQKLQAIEDSVRGDVQVGAKLDTGQALADFKRFMAYLRAEGDRGVRVKVRTDYVDSGDRESKKGSDQQRKVLGDVNKNSLLRGMPRFGTGINPAGYAVILAAATALLAPVLGIITTALLSIPGLIAAVATPIAALTLGLDGLKKAAQVLTEPFERLKETLSVANENNFTPVFESLRSIFPVLESSLPAVSKGVSDLLQGAVDAVNQNSGQIRETITNIGAALSAAKPGVNDFVSGFINLANELSKTFPNLAQWFNDAASGFRKWVDEGVRSGSLRSAFEGLGTILDTILQSLTNLGKVGFDWAKDPQKVQDFADGLKDVLGVLEDIAALSGNLRDLFRNILPSLNWEGIKKDLFPGFADFSKSGLDGRASTGGIYNPFSVPAASTDTSGVDKVKASVEQVGEASAQSKQHLDAMLQGAAGTTVSGSPLQALMGNLGGSSLGSSAYAGSKGAEIPPPNLEPAKAEITEYQSFVDSVTQQVRGSLSQATSGESLPAPNFDAFKAAWSELPNSVQQAMSEAQNAALSGVQGIVNALSAGSNAIVSVVTSWPVAVQAALSSMNVIGQEAGIQLANGMVAGINQGIGWVTAAAANMASAAKVAAENALGIESPSKEFERIGQYTAQGMGIGMEKGFGPVLAQAKDIAWKISEAFANGGDPTTTLQGFGNDEVGRLEKVLSFEAKRLELQAKALTYQSKITGNEALKAKAEELRLQKDQITLQKEMLDLTQEYADLSGNPKLADSPFGQTIEDAMKMPFDFAKATGSQFLNDFGISGGGALGAIADWGTQFGSQFVFNVSNVDEAMAVQRNQVNKQAMGVVGR